MSSKQTIILDFVKAKPLRSSKEIHEGVKHFMGYATVKRILSGLRAERMVIAEGAGRGTRYKTGPAFDLFYPIDTNHYFKQEIDERSIISGFNHKLIREVLPHVQLFSDDELRFLGQLHQSYSAKLEKLSPSLYKKEMERLSIDLSWKSSQIEGNTYSLLETERLLKENQTAEGKSNEEATMLLNHKKAIDQIIANPGDLFPITPHSIEKIHTMLVAGLGVELGTRTTGVGITGTNYKPLEYEQQIIGAMNDMCQLIAQQNAVFNKALLLLVLISYIQPYADGNKRTARIASNAVLIHEKTCPVSFRTTDSMEFKKAMLLFYEQNNMTRIKEIFMEQYNFAVNTYF
ncbi:MAG: Fic family protein [Bacteroidota bacterium]|nr:Fic family protein [Bacteroidota bacterium]